MQPNSFYNRTLTLEHFTFGQWPKQTHLNRKPKLNLKASPNKEKNPLWKCKHPKESTIWSTQLLLNSFLLLINWNAKTVKWQPQVHLNTLVIEQLNWQILLFFFSACFFLFDIFRFHLFENPDSVKETEIVSENKTQNKRKLIIFGCWTK